ncbi:MAG: sarcosine oxidase subunit gamma [Arenicella sp.]|jgi:sarcosine oxidase subunit gamma
MSAEIQQPEAALRRSPLARYHQSRGASFVFRAGGAAVKSYAHETEKSKARAQSIAVVDLTCLNRIGFKGADTSRWLSSKSLKLPNVPNQSLIGTDGTLVARLSATEFMILDTTANDGQKVESLRSAWSMDLDQRSYLLERGDSHSWFAVTGELAPQMLAKVCAVDLRIHKFRQLAVAQTSVARSNSIVVRADQGLTPCFYILADLSSSAFMWASLLDSMQEFSGDAIGLDAFNTLSAT